MFKLLLWALLLGLVFGEVTYDAKTKTFLDSSMSDSVNMIVMGDWGGLPFFPYYSPFEKITAKQMIETAAEQQTDFILALGDNFYYNGVVNEFDSRFMNTFEKVFNDPGFNHINWFVVGGNHDHYGNITGQTEYSKHSSRWMFPDLWYAIRVVRPSFNMTIVMIDTVTLCGNTLHDEEGGQPDGKIDRNMEADQLTFIENYLKNSKDQYVFVAGHFPVWSVAEHGPTKCLLEKLKPLLEKYSASAYLCGHDHNLQHLRETTSTVEYFVSGAVDVVDPNKTHENAVPQDSLQFYWADILGGGGFATLNATEKAIAFSFRSATGSNLYNYKIKPRR